MKRLSIALTALAFVLASGSAISGSSADSLAKGSHSNIKYVTMKDFHNQADLDAFMATAFDKGHAPDLGTVDWTKNMVFGLFAGYQQHSGYQIRITKVDDSGDTIQVFWKVIIPCEERSGSDDTQPFLFATFPASTKPVNINTPDSENQRC
jgi:hypothetical protein